MPQRKNHINRPLRIAKVMFHRKFFLLVVYVLVMLAMILCLIKYCTKVEESLPTPNPRSWTEIQNSGILRVVTLPSSYTAIEYNEEWYGYEYENARKVANCLGLDLEIILVKSEKEVADSLFSGAADLGIWPMSSVVMKDFGYLKSTGNQWKDSQCLTYLRKLDLKMWKDTTLTDSMIQCLPKYPLTLIEGSRQWAAYLSDSVQQNFDFRPFELDNIPSDSLTIEQLTDSLIVGKVKAIMMRCNVAKLMHDYYPIISISDTIKYSEDTYSWSIVNNSDTLCQKVDSVITEIIPAGTPRYGMFSKKNHHQRARVKNFLRLQMTEGALSVYDDIFRSKGEEYKMDWRLLAAIAYIESNFNHDAVSSRGPLGLMQLMPQTARSYGYTNEEVMDPEINVDIAAKVLSNLRRVIVNRYPNIAEDDLIPFQLTGYNAGIAHLYDAINLADTLGYHRDVWTGNVEHCLRLKSDPNYYKLPVVKAGKFNGDFTINYVNEVTAAYQAFSEKVPRELPKNNKKKAAKKK